jgi:cholesterol transport system auxiliary component
MRVLIALGAAFLASGCSLGLTGKAPPFMLTLSPAQSPAANGGVTVRSADVLVVETPLVPQAIAVNRVPVGSGDTVIAYVKDAVWVEPPARLFQRLVAETLRSKTGKTVLDARQLSTAAGQTLSGHLLRFDIEEGSNRAVVVYDAAVSGADGKTIKTRRFEAREAVGVIDARGVGSALNRAANSVAGDVAAWVGG